MGRLERFWHSDEDEWHYRGAVVIEFPLGALRAGDIVLEYLSIMLYSRNMN
jgi:hypothetical protein